MVDSLSKVTLRLLQLHCYFVDENDFDDVFLMFDGKKIWPSDKKQQAIMMDTTTDLNLKIENLTLYQDVRIELWDWDLLTPNDLLGTFNLIIEGKNQQFSTDMIQNQATRARYTLVWDLVDTP